MSPLGLNRRRIAVTAAYNLPHVILNARCNQGYPLPRQVSSPRAVALLFSPNASLIAATRAADGEGRERGRLSDSVSSLLHNEELFPNRPAFNTPPLFPSLISVQEEKSKQARKAFLSVFFFLTTLSLYLLRLLPLHYHFLIFFMHCPRGIFSLLPSRRCSFSNFCSAPSVVVGLSQFHAQVYGHIEKQIQALSNWEEKESLTCQPKLLSSFLYFKFQSFLSEVSKSFDWIGALLRHLPNPSCLPPLGQESLPFLP